MRGMSLGFMVTTPLRMETTITAGNHRWRSRSGWSAERAPGMCDSAALLSALAFSLFIHGHPLRARRRARLGHFGLPGRALRHKVPGANGRVHLAGDEFRARPV